VTEVKAMALSYFLDVSEEWRIAVGDKWERKFIQDVEKYLYLYPDLEVRRKQINRTRVSLLTNQKIIILKTKI